MPGQFWEQDSVVAPPAPQASGPRPIYAAPDPRGSAQESRAEQGAANDQVRMGLDISGEERATRQEGRATAQTEFDNIDKLRQRYDAMPEVKAYRQVLPQLMAALKLPGDGTGDSALVYSWSKVMDPLGAVREGDVAMASSGASMFESRAAQLAKEFNLAGGGNLPQEVRDSLKRDMNQKVAELGRSYMTARERFSADAQDSGLDPVRVVGPHDSLPFRDDYYRLMGDRVERPGQQVGSGVPAGVIGGSGGGGVQDPTNADIYANGVEFGMDKWGKDDPFDRAGYLQSTYGLGGGDEDQIIGFWNANSGNQNLSPDLVRGWYQGRGLPVPSDEDLVATIAKAKAGAKFGGIDTQDAERRYADQLDAVLAGRGFNDQSTTGNMGVKAAQGITWGALDELVGIAGGVNAAMRGENPVAGYQVERDVERRAQQRASDNSPVMGALSEIAGGLVSGGVGMAGAKSIPDAARMGAITGGIAGFNYGEGAAGSLGGAVGGAALGGAAGAGAQRLGEVMDARQAARAAQAASAPTQGQRVMQAADRINTQFGTNLAPIPADVGGQGVRNATGAAAKMPFGAALIGRTRDRLTDQGEAARNAIASLAGTADTNIETAGETALRGAQSFIQRSRTKVNTLYERARRLGGDQPVDLAGARMALDAHIAELQATPGGAKGLAEMQALRAELDAPFPVEGVKRMRSQLRDRFMGDGLRGSDLERRMSEVIEAADQDIAEALVQAGKPEAAQAYAEASAAHAERVAVIDEVLAPIIGRRGDAPRSGEEIIGAIEASTKRNGARLGKFMASLPAEDASTLRASLIERLGRPTNGQATEETTFSLGSFLTQWNAMTDRAKSALFGGELRAALDDLATVAGGRKEAGRSVNFSNTGAATGLLASMGAVAGASVTPWTLSLLALDGMTGAVLASPRVARWMAKAPKTQVAQRSHVAALTKLAAAEPVIAADILGLQRQLLSVVEGGRGAASLNAPALPLAAQESTQSGGSDQAAQVPR